jgi:hypothetical protein
MNIPEQLIPLSDKGPEFIKKTALALASMAKGSGKSKRNDEIAWDYYNGKIDREKFKYLTHVGDLKLPSVMRRISIQRPPINLLRSQMSRRPFVFSTVVIDEESVKEKFKNQFTFILKQIESHVREQHMIFEIQYKKLVQQEQQIMQMLQKEPESEEEAMQIAQLRQQLPEIETSIRFIKEEFERKLTLTQEEMENIEEMLKYSYKDIKEILAQKGVKKLREVHNTNDERLSYFTDKIVTGKGCYYVDFIPRSKNIIFRSLDSMQVHHPSIPGVKWIEEGPWALIEDWISYSQLIDEHGDSKELTEEVMKKLEYYKEYSAGNEVGMPNANVYTGAKSHQNGINRKRIWWKSPRKIFIKKSPNKHQEGKEFRHFINDEKLFNTKIDKKKGESLTHRYIYDLFTAVVIDDKYIVDGRRIDKPLRMVDNYSWTQLPIIGRSYSSYSEEPYSLIWNTKDIQDLYDIVYYHRELYIAASGVKGQIVDLSQKPKKMSLPEHRYHKKTGTLYIETVDKTGKKVQSPYNQWKDYDDTISPAIQYLEGILQSLEETCNRTMGVTRQRMGQMVSTDQVGTSEMAVDQSALITEILFYESDQVEARAIRRAINLQCKFLWDKGGVIQFTNPDLTTEIVKIPSNLLNNSDYDIHILNNTNEEKTMQEIKMLAMRQNDKGLLPFKHLVQVYNHDSVVQLQKAIIKWTEKAEKLQQASMENQQRAMAEAEQAKVQLENEFKMMIEKDKKELETFKLQLQQAALEQEKNYNMTQAMLKEKEIDSRKEIDYLKIVSNRDVEMNYLGEQSRNNQMQEKINILQLKLQELQMRINASLGVQDEILKDKEIDAKKEIETKKMRDKNRIKN